MESEDWEPKSQWLCLYMQIGPNDSGVEFYLSPYLGCHFRGEVKKEMEVIGNGRTILSLAHFLCP